VSTVLDGCKPWWFRTSADGLINYGKYTCDRKAHVQHAIFKFSLGSTTISLAMTSKAVPNGSAEAPVVSTLPPVVGINLGNSFASIAVFTKVKDVVVLRLG
jgi:hypothetical protein